MRDSIQKEKADEGENKNTTKKRTDYEKRRYGRKK